MAGFTATIRTPRAAAAGAKPVGTDQTVVDASSGTDAGSGDGDDGGGTDAQDAPSGGAAGPKELLDEMFPEEGDGKRFGDEEGDNGIDAAEDGGMLEEGTETDQDSAQDEQPLDDGAPAPKPTKPPKIDPLHQALQGLQESQQQTAQVMQAIPQMVAQSVQSVFGGMANMANQQRQAQERQARFEASKPKAPQEGATQEEWHKFDLDTVKWERNVERDEYKSRFEQMERRLSDVTVGTRTKEFAGQIDNHVEQIRNDKSKMYWWMGNPTLRDQVITRVDTAIRNSGGKLQYTPQLMAQAAHEQLQAMEWYRHTVGKQRQAQESPAARRRAEQAARDGDRRVPEVRNGGNAPSADGGSGGGKRVGGFKNEKHLAQEHARVFGKKSRSRG